MIRYYVTADTGPTYGALLGPFGTKREAEQRVGLGRELANARSARAVFYGFGVTKVESDAEVKTTFDLDGNYIGAGTCWKKLSR